MPQLTDDEVDAIMSAAWPLHPSQRGAFEQTVLTEWQRLPVEARGPGSLHRIIAAAQKDALRGGPLSVGPGNLSHYRKRSLLRDKGSNTDIEMEMFSNKTFAPSRPKGPKRK